MSIGINSSYSSYYTQASNKTGVNNDKTKVSDADKTTVSSTSTTDKTISKDEYFKNLCERYSGANLHMSSSGIMKKNEITYNISPKLVDKATKDSKYAEKLEGLLSQIQSFKEYFNTHKYTLGGSEVKSVSVVIDENDGVSGMLDIEPKNSKNTSNTKDSSKTSEEEKLRIKRMKEKKERNLKLSKEHKIYSDIATNIDMSFLDRFDTNI
ncbi:hypothetical protein CLOBY_36190 [Clostridium saccharobutylicum]|uniref:DUF6033 family protein n=1 Tax=Clostridium saccharobutylicum TaxID=169679 RepID=UPI00098398D3|nr:DUF6033 family protein [Clostridium saccharobutylicum]AQS11463.1 hypothetical protein CLOBY_36190 [Clostridium saccharobutylicum]MBC2435134.1 hypothetical protein [Clostridium saccharobutylicum]NSB88611.1 hypothetical protein [Clostridium saccharobutylicum]NYC30553.1 hypothetical protein [Clostridium saccharobutylicum]OOM17027.1 hypothetical protein CLSAB_20940 [Clostridium saccharobutylicum]